MSQETGKGNSGPLYRVGEVSTIVHVSVKTLHHYHESGLLEPAKVDPETSYRYYDDAGIERLRLIRRLRDLGFSIPEIKNLLDRQAAGKETRPILATKLGELRARQLELRRVEADLRVLLAEDGAEPGPGTTETAPRFAPEERELLPLLVAEKRFRGSYPELGDNFPALFRSAWRHYGGLALGLMYEAEYKEEGADLGAAVSLKKEAALPGLVVRKLEGGRAVCLSHEGPYESIGKSYQLLFAHLNGRNLKLRLPIRELYIKGPGGLFPRSPRNYLTEIQFLVD